MYNNKFIYPKIRFQTTFIIYQEKSIILNLHIFFVASFWPQHVGVDKYIEVSLKVTFKVGTITLLNSH